MLFRSAQGYFSATVGNNFVGDSAYAFEQFSATAARAMGSTFVAALQASALPDGIKKFFNGLTDQTAIADATNSLVTMQKALGYLPPVFKSIQDAIDSTSSNIGITELKSRFSAIGTYTDLFYSDQEKLGVLTKAVGLQFDSLNTAMPKSRDEFRKLVDGSTGDLFDGLISLAPAFDSYLKALDAQKTALNQNAQLTQDVFATAVDFNRYQAVAANDGFAYANAYTSLLPQYDANPTGVTQAQLLATLEALIVEIRAGNISAIVSTQETAKTLRRWNNDGMPAVRVTA